MERVQYLGNGEGSFFLIGRDPASSAVRKTSPARLVRQAEDHLTLGAVLAEQWAEFRMPESRPGWRNEPSPSLTDIATPASSRVHMASAPRMPVVTSAARS